MNKKLLISTLVITLLLLSGCDIVEAEKMKSYDLDAYEVVEFHYDNIMELEEGIYTEETEGIRKQFESYKGQYESECDPCTQSIESIMPGLDGGYVKLELDDNKLIVKSNDEDGIEGNIGLYDGKWGYASKAGYTKEYFSESGARNVKEIKRIAKALMQEKSRVITDKRKLYNYTTLLTGNKPEKVVMSDENDKTISGYDAIITKIEFVDQGTTRLVKIDLEGIDIEEFEPVYDTTTYFKIVLKKDATDFDKEYKEKYEEVKDIPFK